ncbi:MAG: ABC transporter ATP-binding protein [Bacilli bacterium]|nr:ABC transporter ATP-binding protein [Bacilli bacterium]
MSKKVNEKSIISVETKKILKLCKLQFLGKFLISLLVRGILLIIPLLYSDAIEAVTNDNFSLGYNLIIISIIVTAFYYLSEIVNDVIYYKLYNKIYNLYTKLATESTIKNSMYSLSRFSLGEYTNILNSDVEIISAFFSDLVMRTVQILEFIFIYTYFLNINIYIFVVTLIISVFSLVYLIENGKKIQENNFNRKLNLDKKTSIIHNVFLGIKEVKGFNIYSKIGTKIEEGCNNYLKSNAKYNNKSNITKFISLLFIDVFRLILIIYMIYLVSQGNMNIGTILVVYTYYGKIIDNFKIVSTLNVQVRNVSTSLNRFNKILEYSNQKKEKQTRKLREYNGKITFLDVIYGNKNDPILNNVSFEILPNCITVITGKAGTGKTGVFDLLLKMNRKHSGKILIDDIEIERINNDVYYNLVSIVRKEHIFLDMSIKDNLLLIDDDFDRVIEICKILHIHDYICSLSNGYDTNINSKEDNITNNVKQLLSIARVLIKNSKIMLFDETISILEKNSQDIVLDLLDKLKEDHTIVIITREKNVIKHADNIIVMNDNSIKEIGTEKGSKKNKKNFYGLYYGDI